MAQEKFNAPFGANGDRKDIPQTQTGNGSLSWDKGFGTNYGQAGNAYIERSQFNEILYQQSAKILDVEAKLTELQSVITSSARLLDLEQRVTSIESGNMNFMGSKEFKGNFTISAPTNVNSSLSVAGAVALNSTATLAKTPTNIVNSADKSLVNAEWVFIHDREVSTSIFANWNKTTLFDNTITNGASITLSANWSNFDYYLIKYTINSREIIKWYDRIAFLVASNYLTTEASMVTGNGSILECAYGYQITGVKTLKILSKGGGMRFQLIGFRR